MADETSETPGTTLRGPAVLLIGSPGSGKTYSLPTIIEAGLELAVVITDPGGEEALIDSMEMRGVDMNKLYWHYIPPSAPNWAGLKDMAHKINTMGYEDLASLKTGVAKHEYTQFFQLLSSLTNFKDDRTGKVLGPVDNWNPLERVLAIDGLSGMNRMAWGLTVGAKPTAHQGEWGVAMNCLESFLDKFTSDIDCMRVLIAHVERETDELTGGTSKMVGTLGRKLAPKIPRNFSDVIYAKREGVQFFWSTIEHGVDLKTRSLPLQDKLPPDFGSIIEAWGKRKEIAKVPQPSLASA